MTDCEYAKSVVIIREFTCGPIPELPMRIDTIKLTVRYMPANNPKWEHEIHFVLANPKL